MKSFDTVIITAGRERKRTIDPWLKLCGVCQLPDCIRDDGDYQVHQKNGVEFPHCLIWEGARRKWGPEKTLKKRGRLLEQRRLADMSEGGMTTQEIANVVFLSRSTVLQSIRAAGGGRKLKPIGCPKCKTHPKAKGKCSNCYQRWWQREKKNG